MRSGQFRCGATPGAGRAASTAVELGPGAGLARWLVDAHARRSRSTSPLTLHLAAHRSTSPLTAPPRRSPLHLAAHRSTTRATAPQRGPPLNNAADGQSPCEAVTPGVERPSVRASGESAGQLRLCGAAPPAELARPGSSPRPRPAAPPTPLTAHHAAHRSTTRVTAHNAADGQSLCEAATSGVERRFGACERQIRGGAALAERHLGPSRRVRLVAAPATAAPTKPLTAPPRRSPLHNAGHRLTTPLTVSRRAKRRVPVWSGARGGRAASPAGSGDFGGGAHLAGRAGALGWSPRPRRPLHPRRSPLNHCSTTRVTAQQRR